MKDIPMGIKEMAMINEVDNLTLPHNPRKSKYTESISMLIQNTFGGYQILFHSKKGELSAIFHAGSYGRQNGEWEIRPSKTPKGWGDSVKGNLTFKQVLNYVGRMLVVLIILLPLCGEAFGQTGTASWYSYESCIKEGTSGTMANGRRMVNENLTCASWDYPFGTILNVRNIKTGKVVAVEVTDRGPAKRLYRMGRIIDLSPKAFRSITGSLKEGIIQVEVWK